MASASRTLFHPNYLSFSFVSLLIRFSLFNQLNYENIFSKNVAAALKHESHSLDNAKCRKKEDEEEEIFKSD